HDRHIPCVLIQHQALDLLCAGVGCDTDGCIVHDAANGVVAGVSAVGMQMPDDFAEGEHADKFAVLHDDQRPDVLFAHGFERFCNGHVRGGGIKGVSLDAQYLTDFQHGGSPPSA